MTQQYIFATRREGLTLNQVDDSILAYFFFLWTLKLDNSKYVDVLLIQAMLYSLRLLSFLLNSPVVKRILLSLWVL